MRYFIAFAHILFNYSIIELEFSTVDAKVVISGRGCHTLDFAFEKREEWFDYFILLSLIVSCLHLNTYCMHSRSRLISCFVGSIGLTLYSFLAALLFLLQKLEICLKILEVFDVVILAMLFDKSVSMGLL